ncbi:MAG: lipocalin family protein [Flavobacterium sp.]|nr:lipocalin family protein [Flavobacterium sp.]
MKKLTTLLLAATSLFFITACTDDDDTIVDDSNNNTDTELAGTYRIIAYSAPTEQDLNEDGTSSVNLVGENDCYSDWTITLNNDNTFSRQEKLVTIFEGEITCEILSDEGTWSKDQETITLVNMEGTELNSEYTYLDATNSLSQTRQGTFPTMFEEVYIMENGTIGMIFARE